MDEKIRIHRGKDRVRLRPAVIFSSDDLEGAEYAVEMILSIMCAESMDGYSEQLIITLHDDLSVEMEDFGRGMYLGDNWGENFCELYAGSQMNLPGLLIPGVSLFEKSGYSTKSISYYDDMTLCAVQYATEYMDVRVHRDGYEWHLHFEKGENIGGLKTLPYSGKSGTYIRFKLDSSVFSDINIPYEYWIKQANKLALISPGVKIKLRTENNDSREWTFYYPGGIADYLRNNPMPVFCSELKAEGQDRYNWPRYQEELRIGLTFTNSPGSQECYHNGRKLPLGGTHIDAIIDEIQKGFTVFWILNRSEMICGDILSW